MNHLLRQIVFLHIISTQIVLAAPSFSIKSVKCPNPCKGENKYKIFFQLADGYSISSSSGIIINDTISNIDPGYSYSVKITIKDLAGNETIEQIPLPICDFFPPDTPMVVASSNCEGTIPYALVVNKLNNGQVINWYDSNNLNVPIQTTNSSSTIFRPAYEGLFYAQTIDTLNGCNSSLRSFWITTKPSLCIPSSFIVKKM